MNTATWVLALAVLMGSLMPTANAGRSLAEYAPANCEAYTIQGECVNKEGMEVAGEYREFKDKCKWSPDLLSVADELLSCYDDVGKKCGLKVKICTVACAAIKGLVECFTNNCFNKNDCNPITGSSGNGNKGGACFPGSAVVHTVDGVQKALSTVNIGEAVLGVGSDGLTEYSKVFTFMSRYPQVKTAFIRLSTDAGVHVTLTPDHFLFTLPTVTGSAAASSLHHWRYTLPRQVQVGDAIPVVLGAAVGTGQPMSIARIVDVTEVQEVGIFMPMTATASIVVDGVVATQMGSAMPKWFANHRVAQVAIRAMGVAMAVLPKAAEVQVAERMSDLVHSYMTGPFALSSLVSSM